MAERARDVLTLLAVLHVMSSFFFVVTRAIRTDSDVNASTTQPFVVSFALLLSYVFIGMPLSKILVRRRLNREKSGVTDRLFQEESDEQEEILRVQGRDFFYHVPAGRVTAQDLVSANPYPYPTIALP